MLQIFYQGLHCLINKKIVKVIYVCLSDKTDSIFRSFLEIITRNVSQYTIDHPDLLQIFIGLQMGKRRMLRIR